MAGCHKDYHSHPFSAPLSHLQIDFCPYTLQKEEKKKQKPENNPTTLESTNSTGSAKSLTTQLVRRDAGERGRKWANRQEKLEGHRSVRFQVWVQPKTTRFGERRWKREGEVAGFTGPGTRTCSKGQVKQHYTTSSLRQERCQEKKYHKFQRKASSEAITKIYTSLVCWHCFIYVILQGLNNSRLINH